MNRTIQIPLVLTAVAALAALTMTLASCASPTEESSQSSGDCVTDFSCPLGEECGNGGCVPVAPTVYTHIQTASALLRNHLDEEELTWRAAHYDLLIGNIVGNVDAMRAVNPNVRLFKYLIIRYHRYGPDGSHADEWAKANGYDPEEFYLHYQEDVAVPGWESEVFVDGFPPGVIPGWNPDWSPGDPSASARERAMSRIVGHRDVSVDPWYMVNVNYAGFRNFVVDFVAATLDGSRYGMNYASGPIDGIMTDVALYYPIFGEGMLDKTEEYYGIPVDDAHPYPIGVETLYPELTSGLNNRLHKTIDVMPNYGHVSLLSRDDRFSQNVQKTTPWAWGEVWVMYRGYSSPTLGSTRAISYDYDYKKGIANIVRQTRKGGRRVLGARDVAGPPTGTERGKLYTLALYYLVHNVNTFYLYESYNRHNRAEHISTWQWNRAIEFDVGQPDQIPEGTVDFDGTSNSSEHYIMETGPDPYDANLTYRVLARRFTNALVLAKMLPAGSVVDDRSLTTHALNRSYALLNADGTLGEIVTEVQLRNNEGLILIPVD